MLVPPPPSPSIVQLPSTMCRGGFAGCKCWPFAQDVSLEVELSVLLTYSQVKGAFAGCLCWYSIRSKDPLETVLFVLHPPYAQRRPCWLQVLGVPPGQKDHLETVLFVLHLPCAQMQVTACRC